MGMQNERLETEPSDPFARALTRAVFGDPEESSRAARELGRACAEEGRTSAETAHRVLATGRLLEEELDRRGGVGGDLRGHLRALVEDSVTAALEAHEAVRTARRDGWLSFYTHELRNPLNTLVSALWLLRNGNPTQAPKVCDMAERATKKLEAMIKKVRELESNFAEAPPLKAIGQPHPK
jgi:signal transduction histidine kinase